jgi:16S rRNA (cytidine1402-2'-O)-methyltransferase
MLLMESGLYLVPTPLGNLADISRRAVETLNQVDVIACEDTRRTLGLLNHLGISKPLVSYHAHSDQHKTRDLVRQISEGRKVAMVSDAGTPGLSDPGTLLVQAALEAGLPVVSLPGPCAAITALVASGLPTDQFFFIGFLPRRPARAKRVLQKGLATQSTLVIYESPFRAAETLERLVDLGAGIRPAVVARELTKVFEEYKRGSVAELAAQIRQTPLKGEVVLLIDARENEEKDDADEKD